MNFNVVLDVRVALILIVATNRLWPIRNDANEFILPTIFDLSIESICTSLRYIKSILLCFEFCFPCAFQRLPVRVRYWVIPMRDSAVLILMSSPHTARLIAKLIIKGLNWSSTCAHTKVMGLLTGHLLFNRVYVSIVISDMLLTRQSRWIHQSLHQIRVRFLLPLVRQYLDIDLVRGR